MEPQRLRGLSAEAKYSSSSERLVLEKGDIIIRRHGGLSLRSAVFCSSRLGRRDSRDQRMSRLLARDEL
jgi:hypothetical protein